MSEWREDLKRYPVQREGYWDEHICGLYLPGGPYDNNIYKFPFITRWLLRFIHGKDTLLPTEGEDR